MLKMQESLTHFLKQSNLCSIPRHPAEAILADARMLTSDDQVDRKLLQVCLPELQHSFRELNKT